MGITKCMLKESERGRRRLVEHINSDIVGQILIFGFCTMLSIIAATIFSEWIMMLITIGLVILLGIIVILNLIFIYFKCKRYQQME